MTVSAIQRNSNIEILRMMAMLMVLILHSNFLISYPSDSLGSISDYIKVAVQLTNISAVNVFVFISGWFGIKANKKGLLNFLWQVFYWVLLLLILQSFISSEPICAKDFFMCFGLFNGGGWFVSSYLALYLLSPILNSFVKNASNKQLFSVTYAFFVFQTLWGLTLSVGFILMGYSVFSFIGIYLLAQTIKRYNIVCNRKICIVIFILCSLFNFVIYYITSKIGIYYVRDMVVAYINPLVIIQALALFYFARLTPPCNNQYINVLSSSCFAVYLLHVGTPFAIESFKKVMLFINAQYFGIKYILVVSFTLLTIYTLAIIIDQPRRWLWLKLTYLIHN